MSPTTMNEITSGTATAADGTVLGYRRIGDRSRPGLLILHGSMSSGWHHAELAQALAGEFSVVLPDRRGRGLTPEHAAWQGLSRDASDLATLIEATGARSVMGISSGAIIALEAARAAQREGRRRAEKLVVFEPPLFDGPDRATALLERFDRAVAAGKLADAATIGMQGAELGPSFLNRLPVRMVAPMVKLGLRMEAKQARAGKLGEYEPMTKLIPLLHDDFEIVRAGSAGDLARFAGIDVPLMLLGATKSPAYLGSALDRLAEVFPHARRVTVPGGHDVVWNAERRGDPAVVAHAVRTFLA